MAIWVERRGTRLRFATEEELGWIAQAIDADGLWFTLGWPSPMGQAIATSAARRQIAALVMEKVGAPTPFGFALLMPSEEGPHSAELIQATPRAKDRDAFSAIHGFDAILYLAFEHLRLERLSLRVRRDNAQPLAVLRRLGIEAAFEIPLLGASYYCFHIERPTWEARRGKLERRGAGAFSSGEDGR